MGPNDAKKICCFGQETSGANLLDDVTQQVQYLPEIKDSFEAAFQLATKEGVMTEENMRGIRSKLEDVTLHADTFHKGCVQIIPTVKRVLCTFQLTANPRFVQHIYLVKIQTPDDAVGGIYQCMSQRR